MIQASSKPPVEPVWRAISAETMKIPEPIMEPTNIVVESKRPMLRRKPESTHFASAISFVCTMGMSLIDRTYLGHFGVIETAPERLKNQCCVAAVCRHQSHDPQSRGRQENQSS